MLNNVGELGVGVTELLAESPDDDDSDKLTKLELQPPVTPVEMADTQQVQQVQGQEPQQPPQQQLRHVSLKTAGSVGGAGRPPGLAELEALHEAIRKGGCGPVRPGLKICSVRSRSTASGALLACSVVCGIPCSVVRQG
jgi:hypothetical protein